MAATITPRVCAHCGLEREVMVLMAPGITKEFWYLCASDWADGLPKARVEAPPPESAAKRKQKKPSSSRDLSFEAPPDA